MALQAEQMRAACGLLYGHWRDGTQMGALPPALCPADRAEGYGIQAFLEEYSGAPLYGWKIAATSMAGQAHIGVDGPLAGRILAERVIEDGGICPMGGNLMRVAELEFAFRMGKDLPPRAALYTQDEVMDRVAALHPAIEVPDSRFLEFETVGAAQLIADNACAHRFLLGPEVMMDWWALNLAAHTVRAHTNAGIVEGGLGANVLGDPRIAMTWLANELSGQGLTLRAGEVVTTGTCIKPLPIQAGDRITGDFGVLGQVSIVFGA